MDNYTYTDLPLVAYEDHDAGVLVVATVINGVDVPIATQKLGHFAARIEQGAQQAQDTPQDSTAS